MGLRRLTGILLGCVGLALGIAGLVADLPVLGLAGGVAAVLAGLVAFGAAATLGDAELRATTAETETATLRREKGHDIAAACGQLRLKQETEEGIIDSMIPAKRITIGGGGD